jgi:hypothetical protein
MGSCDAVRQHLATLAPLPAEERPAWVREHAASCPSCARALWGHQVMQATVEALLLHRGTAARGTSDETL